MINFIDALEIVFKNLPQPQIHLCTLETAGSYFLAEDIQSPLDLPLFNNSAMDGYALISSDTAGASPHHAVEFKIAGDVQAGSEWPGILNHGQAVRIATGAPIPAQADAVIPVEFTTKKSSDRIAVFRSVRKDENIRFSGEDIKKDDLVLYKHDLLNSGRMAILASLGHTEVKVFRKPQLGFLATGNELVTPDVIPETAQIRNSNTTMIRYLTESEGFKFTDFGIARDEIDSIRQAVQEQDLPDILVTSAGVSVGESDYVITALESLGLKKLFWKVAIKPGKPLYFGKIGQTLYFGLPGNPVSSAVMFLQFILPALRAVAGDLNPFKAVSTAVTDDHFAKTKGRLHFARGVAYHDQVWHARSAGAQGSHILRSYAEANCLLLIPPDQEINKGDKVCIQFDGGPAVNFKTFKEVLAGLLR